MVLTKLDFMRGECVHLLREVGCRNCTNLLHGCVTSRSVYELLLLYDLMNSDENVQCLLLGNGQVVETGTLVTISGLIVLNVGELLGTTVRNQ